MARLLLFVAITLGGLTYMVMRDRAADQAAVNGQGAEAGKPRPAEKSTVAATTQELQMATFGSGCFWCTEAVFQQLKGVQKVVSGYTGGHVVNPTYEQICTATTGHAEVVQVTFDPKIISYDDLLDAFWHSHDPTTPNRQGNDQGPQYRSVVFYHDDEQRKQAEEMKKKLDAADAFGAPIVTQIAPLGEFYAAEKYHQNYFNDNPNQPYCAFVIRPKVDKVRAKYADKLK